MAPWKTAEAVLAQVSSHNKPASSPASRDHEDFLDESVREFGRTPRLGKGLRRARKRSTQLSFYVVNSRVLD